MTTQTDNPVLTDEQVAALADQDLAGMESGENPNLEPVGEPNVSNPGDVDTQTPSNDDDSPIGNVNGVDQENDVAIPTARDTLADKRKRLLEQMVELDKQLTIADVIDIVVDILNASRNTKLADTIKLLDTNENIDIMYEFKTGKWRYASTTRTGKTTTVTQPTPTNGDSKRNWFKTITSPDGIAHDVPMKTDTTMDLEWLAITTGGLDFKKDTNGHSLSHVGKQSLLKKNNWTWTNNS